MHSLAAGRGTVIPALIVLCSLPGCAALDATTTALFPDDPSLSVAPSSADSAANGASRAVSDVSPVSAALSPEATAASAPHRDVTNRDVTHPPASFTVMIKPANGKSTEVQLPLSGPTYVQSVLEQSGAKRRFHRVKLALWRPVQDGHYKLDIRYDRSAKRVVPAFDYAIHPGDRLVIEEDDSTIVDDMMSGLPLPFVTHSRR